MSHLEYRIKIAEPELAHVDAYQCKVVRDPKTGEPKSWQLQVQVKLHDPEGRPARQLGLDSLNLQFVVPYGDGEPTPEQRMEMVRTEMREQGWVEVRTKVKPKVRSHRKK